MSEEHTFKWMTNDYFQQILIKYEGHDQIMMQKFDVSSGTKKGENFASAVLRVVLKYLINGKQKEISLIIKTSPTSSALSDVLSDLGTFEGEANVYKNILDEADRIIPGTKIAPKLVWADKHALVLEDLTELNFKLANRKVRLNFAQAKVLIAKLARFHAISADVYKKDKSLLEHYMVSANGNEEVEMIAFFFSASMEESMKTIRRTPQLEQYVKNLENFDVLAKSREIFSRCEDDKFHVLNHGDLWINNMFFANDIEGQPTDALLVDYQECFWGSPGVDLNHFFYSSCDFDAHKYHLDELIQLYHENLSRDLKSLNFPKIPTLDDIIFEFNRKGHQAIVAICTVVPIMMIENPEHANSEYFASDSEEAAAVRNEVFGNSKFVEILKFFVPKFAERSLI